MAKAIDADGIIFFGTGGNQQRGCCVLPDGTYEFTVGQKRVDRYEPRPGAKLPACDRFGYPLHIQTDEGEAVVWLNLYMVDTQMWKALQFFQGVGLMLDYRDEGVHVDWDAPEGRTGRCVVGHHESSGRTRNDVVKVLPYEPAPVFNE